MIGALATLLVCQLAGEAIVRATGLPVPGPVLGMLLLVAALAIRGAIPTPLRNVANGMLQHLTLLYIPAGVGFMLHIARIKAEWETILAALFVSTILTIIVTALVFKWVARLTDRKNEAVEKGGE